VSLSFSCAPDYNLKIDTVTGALGALYVNEVSFLSYCGILLNSNPAYIQNPQSILALLYQRPIECRESQDMNADCTWNMMEESLITDSLQYSISEQETEIYRARIQNDGSIDAQALIHMLNIEVEEEGYFELSGTENYLASIEEDRNLEDALDVYRETQNDIEQEFSYVAIIKKIEWSTTKFFKHEVGESLENTFLIDGMRYRRSDEVQTTSLLYPCLQPFGIE